MVLASHTNKKKRGRLHTQLLFASHHSILLLEDRKRKKKGMGVGLVRVQRPRLEACLEPMGLGEWGGCAWEKSYALQAIKALET